MGGFQHKSVGTSITQAEWEQTDTGHQFASQATGMMLYSSSSTVNTSLAIGSTSAFLQVVGGVPAWTLTPIVADNSFIKFGTDGDSVILNRSTTLSADAEVSNVIEGASSHPGVAANSLLISNVTNDGDIMFLVSDGGNSKGLLKLKGSDGSIELRGLVTAAGIIKTDDTTNATTTTDGSLQTDGGLSVVLDAVFGDDVSLLSDGAILNMGAGNDFTITHDGTTGATIAGTPLVFDSLGASALANDTYTGIVFSFISNEAIAIGNAVYIHTTDGRIGVADANALATMPAIGVAVSATGSAGNAVKVLTHGIYNDSDGFSGDLTEGATMYLGETTGAVTATIPDADGDFVQIMGIACGPRDVFISPSMDIIERA